MIDTLKLSKSLQRAGMSEAQAEVMTEALKDAETDYVTKADLALAINGLEMRLTKLVEDTRHQTLLAIGLLVLAQVGLHFWK